MLIITLNQNGYSENQIISEDIFKAVGNTIVRVICEKHFYGDSKTLMGNICRYMTGFMPDGCNVQTDYVVLYHSSGSDIKGAYIERIDFQVFI